MKMFSKKQLERFRLEARLRASTKRQAAFKEARKKKALLERLEETRAMDRYQKALSAPKDRTVLTLDELLDNIRPMKGGGG